MSFNPHPFTTSLPLYVLSPFTLYTHRDPIVFILAGIAGIGMSVNAMFEREFFISLPDAAFDCVVPGSRIASCEVFATMATVFPSG